MNSDNAISVPKLKKAVPLTGTAQSFDKVRPSKNVQEQGINKSP